MTSIYFLQKQHVCTNFCVWQYICSVGKTNTQCHDSPSHSKDMSLCAVRIWSGPEIPYFTHFPSFALELNCIYSITLVTISFAAFRQQHHCRRDTFSNCFISSVTGLDSDFLEHFTPTIQGLSLSGSSSPLYIKCDHGVSFTFISILMALTPPAPFFCKNDSAVSLEGHSDTCSTLMS